MMNGQDLKFPSGIEPALDDEKKVVQFLEKPFIFSDDLHRTQLLQSLNVMRKNRTFCDVILHVRNTELYAHRVVLASVSLKLMELLSVDDEENVSNPQQGHTVQITLDLNPMVQVVIMEKIIEYAYTGSLEVQSDEVRNVFLAASYLKINTLINECAKYLTKHLNVDNCIEIRSLPGISSKRSFIQQLDEFISTNFTKIRERTSFLSLPSLKVDLLTQTRQEMSMVSGDSLSLMVMDWIKREFSHSNGDVMHDRFIDKTHLLYLALDNSLQDCSQLPDGDVSDTQLVQEYKKMSKKSPKSDIQIQNGQRMAQMQSAKPRVLIYNKEFADSRQSDVDSDFLVVTTDKLTENTFLSLVLLNNQLVRLSIMLKLNTDLSDVINMTPLLQSRCSSYESIPDTYCSLLNMSSRKCAMGCVAFNGHIFVCGGYDSVECLKTVERYNPDENMWQQLPSMKEARGRFGICVADGCVYAIGGSNGTTELDTVECYNPQKDKWCTVANLPIPKSYAGICSLNNKVYCIGGWNGHGYIKHCDVYDPTTNCWSSISPLQTGRYQVGVCTFNGLIYAAGGSVEWICLNSVEVYDPKLNSWIYIKPLSTARRGCGAIVFKEKLYVIGGSDGSSSLDTVEIYDISLGEWRTGPKMNVPRSNVGVAVIDDRLYAVGGFSGKKFLSSIEYLEEKINKWTVFTQRTVPSSLTTSMHEEEQLVNGNGQKN